MITHGGSFRRVWKNETLDCRVVTAEGPKRAVCILGMHRSGTSVLARALNLLGVYLGEPGDLLPPAPDNQAGVWERADVNDLHNRLLAHFSGSWRTPIPLPLGWHRLEDIKQFRDELIDLIRRHFYPRSLWGWKDPRTCLVLPLWQEALRELGIELLCVYVVRSPLDAARSLGARDRLSHDKSVGLWFAYNVRAITACFDTPTVFVSYDSFLNDWELQLRRCARQLHLPWPDNDSRLKEQMREFIRPDLRHNVSRSNDVEERVVPLPVIRLGEILDGLAQGSIVSMTSVREEATKLDKAYSSYARFFRDDLQRLWNLEREIVDKSQQINSLRATIEAQERIIRSFETSLGGLVIRQYKRLTNRAFPPGTRRAMIYGGAIRGLRTLVTEGVYPWWKRWASRSHRAPWKDHFAYQRWIRAKEPDRAQLDAMRRDSEQWPYQPKISIITPLYNTGRYDLTECIRSVMAQTYQNWELCLVDGGSRKKHVAELIKETVAKDRRVKCTWLSDNKGIAGNSNEAIRLATGDYVAFLDHDDTLAPFALHEVVKLLNQDPAVDIIYSDEDKIPSRSNRRYAPFFKPDWAPDTFLSYNYLCHFLVVRRAVVERIGGFREGYDGSQDYDFILRATEMTTSIKRIPKVLYHWRASPTSVASNMSIKPYAYPAAKRALMEHLGRRGLSAEIADGFALGAYRVQYRVRPFQQVSIVIPTKDQVSLLKTCVSSILSKTDHQYFDIVIVDNQSEENVTHEFFGTIRHNPKIRLIQYDSPFNFSAINNFAVRFVDSEYIVFLNNDTEIISPGWLSAMLEFAQRSDVGAVGAKLYYPDDTVQHAGVVIGLGGVAGHLYQGWPRPSHGDMGRLSVVQNVSAVTAACMMLRRAVFEEVGGFDERLSHAFNDVDLCLRIREKGYLNVFTPYAELYHHESASRGYDLATPERTARFAKEVEFMKARWKHVLDAGDPYYNPNLTLERPDFSLKL